MSAAIAMRSVTPDMLVSRGHEMCRIRSGEHRAWWRPDRQGYTTVEAVAGRYTLADAHAASRHCGPEKMIWFEIEPAA